MVSELSEREVTKVTRMASEPPSAQSISGFTPKSDPISCEKKLASAVIFLAWKDACEGDKGAFRFALGDDSAFPLWCKVCDLDISAVRACFERLQAGERMECPVVDYRRRWVPNALSLSEVRQAVRLFIQLKPMSSDRKEVFTWIALELEKKVQTVENLFFMLARRAKERKSNIYLTGLKKEFWEAWTENGG